ncbi:MAG: TIGR00730 family Rossman fold protein [Flammeovirgaceae bacterium]|nr:MAG: TIGR00730 family Rossman fold protein [Flammeovirgaceae bacterium]
MNIAVFCGSATGKNSVYADAARELGVLLAQRNHTLVYGGGNIGLMGILADAVLNHHGKVIGVIPGFLFAKEVGHTGLSHLEIVGSMHERKQRMADLAHAFVMMPGGWGTLDETAEILTWRQLGLINLPVGILNINSFYNPLIAQMQRMTDEGFLKPVYLNSVIIEDSPAALLDRLSLL